MKTHRIERIVSWPRSVPANYDANGAPCDEPGHGGIVELLVTLMPYVEVEFIPINVGFETCASTKRTDSCAR